MGLSPIPCPSGSIQYIPEGTDWSPERASRQVLGIAILPVSNWTLFREASLRSVLHFFCKAIINDSWCWAVVSSLVTFPFSLLTSSSSFVFWFAAKFSLMWSFKTKITVYDMLVYKRYSIYCRDRYGWKHETWRFMLMKHERGWNMNVLK